MSFKKLSKHHDIEDSEDEGEDYCDLEDEEEEDVSSNSKFNKKLRKIFKFFWKHKIATLIGTILLSICLFPFWIAATYVFDNYSKFVV